MTDSLARAPYSHRYHAANVGDVWKHLALVALLRRHLAAHARVCYVDTHSGEGRYKLGPAGEWTEGLGRIWSTDDRPAGFEDAELTEDWRHFWTVFRGLSAPTERPTSIPGSPALAQAMLRADDSVQLWELADDAVDVLRRRVGDDNRVSIHQGDGPAALASSVAEAKRAGYAPVVLVDPPWSDKSEWRTVPLALIDTAQAHPDAVLALWYPIKSLTRPNAMLSLFREAAIPATAVELVTTPLELKRKRLNGSGMLFVHPPAGLVGALLACAPPLGRLCSTEGGPWSLRAVHLG